MTDLGELFPYFRIFYGLLKSEDQNAKKMCELIGVYGVKSITPIENDKIKGEYVAINGDNPVYFVGIRLESNQQVVEIIS